MKPSLLRLVPVFLAGLFLALTTWSAESMGKPEDMPEFNRLRIGKMPLHHPTLSQGEVEGPEAWPADAGKLRVSKKVMDEIRGWDRRIWFFTSAAQPLSALDELAKGEICTWGLELVGQVDRLRQLIGAESVRVLEPGAFFMEKKTPPRLYITWSGHAPALKGAVVLALEEIPEPAAPATPAAAKPETENTALTSAPVPEEPAAANPETVEIDRTILAAGMTKAQELGCNPIPAHAAADGKFIPCPEAKFKINPQDRRFTVVNGDMIYNVGSRPLAINGMTLTTGEAAIILNSKLVKLGEKLK